MRQGNGSDLLGANDPRSSTIGIIYVAPNDDRESVLAAILTQERLKRKQIAVVLPGQNKAFQRPVDFDGLKNMRNKLDATLVIVAPHGSSPAEFARQRRFTLFTSLDNYRQSLQQENEAARATRRGWPFGRQSKLQSIPASPASTPSTQPPASTGEAQEQMVSPSADAGHADVKEDEPHANGGALGLGLGLGAGAAAVYAGEHSMHPPEEQPPPADGQNNVEPLAPAAPSNDKVDDDLALPAPPSAPTTADDSVSGTPEQQDALPPPSADAVNADEHADNGGIITFSPTPQSSGRTTRKIPVPPVVPLPESSPDDEAKVTPIQRRRDRGKKAAIGAAVVGAGVGAGAVGAAKVTPTPSPSSAPPRPGSTGTPPPRRRRLALLLLVLAALLLVSVALYSTIALAAPGTFGALGSALTHALPVGNPSATVTIVPKHADELNFYVIQAIVKGTPNSSKRQVRARLLTSPAETQSKTVNATGVKNFPALAATGTLTFYNGNNVDELVSASNTVFTVGNVQIKLSSDVDIPAATPNGRGVQTVNAYADPRGASGNIAALAINQFCCGNSAISVQNLNAFSGGQDASSVKIVQQSDIDSAANPLKAPLQRQALASPNLKKQANEQFLDHQPTCKTDVTSDHAAGDQADTVTVTVTVTCTGDVYDQVGAETIAANLLRQQASKDLSTDYKLVGNLVTQIVQVNNDTQGNIDLRIKAEGIWVFQFTDTQIANLKKLIAGKSKPEAKAILEQQPGVDSVGTIEISGANGSTLPTDVTQIQIIIQPVLGLQGSPTSTPATTPVPITSPISK